MNDLPVSALGQRNSQASRPLPLGDLNYLGSPMLIGIAVLLAVIWLVSFLAFHVSSFLIHLLLLAAVISIVMHFLKGRSAT